jgi:hypothetical protein
MSAFGINFTPFHIQSEAGNCGAYDQKDYRHILEIIF